MGDKGHQLLVTRCVENLRENNDVDRKKLLDRDLVRSSLEARPLAEVAIRTPQKGSHNSSHSIITLLTTLLSGSQEILLTWPSPKVPRAGRAYFYELEK